MTIGDIVVAQKDFILADETCLVCVPRARIDEVLALAEGIAAQEARLEAQVVNDAVASWDQV